MDPNGRGNLPSMELQQNASIPLHVTDTALLQYEQYLKPNCHGAYFFLGVRSPYLPITYVLCLTR